MRFTHNLHDFIDAFAIRILMEGIAHVVDKVQRRLFSLQRDSFFETVLVNDKFEFFSYPAVPHRLSFSANRSA